MMKKGLAALKVSTALALCLGLASCEEPRVYGSVGFSSYSGGYHGGGIGTSVSIGGRIR
jgi:hypothetical protein